MFFLRRSIVILSDSIFFSGWMNESHHFFSLFPKRFGWEVRQLKQLASRLAPAKPARLRRLGWSMEFKDADGCCETGSSSYSLVTLWELFSVFVFEGFIGFLTYFSWRMQNGRMAEWQNEQGGPSIEDSYSWCFKVYVTVTRTYPPNRSPERVSHQAKWCRGPPLWLVLLTKSSNQMV